MTAQHGRDPPAGMNIGEAEYHGRDDNILETMTSLGHDEDTPPRDGGQSLLCAEGRHHPGLRTQTRPHERRHRNGPRNRRSDGSRAPTERNALDMKAQGRGIDIVRMKGWNDRHACGLRAPPPTAGPGKRNEKPLLGSPDTCPMRHVGYCLSGRLVVRMVRGQVPETPITKGDFFEIPPGHDAYVDGTDRVELILFEPPAHADEERRTTDFRALSRGLAGRRQSA